MKTKERKTLMLPAKLHQFLKDYAEKNNLVLAKMVAKTLAEEYGYQELEIVQEEIKSS